MHVNYSDLTPKQKHHMARIYLWISTYRREFWWGEDSEYSERTIKSLIRKGLLLEFSKYAVDITDKGEEIGRSCFVRTNKHDAYAVEIGFM